MKQGHYKSAVLRAFVLCAPALFSSCCPVFAATYDNRAGSTNGFQFRYEPRAYVVEQTHDFSSRSVTTGDVVRLINIPPQAKVTTVQVEILTACTPIGSDNQYVSIGDGFTPAGWISGIIASTVASSDSSPTLSASLTPQAVSLPSLLPSVLVTGAVLEVQSVDLGGTNVVTNAILSVQSGAPTSADLMTNGTISVSVSPPYAMGKYYGNHDTIDLLAYGRITNGVIRVRAAAIDFSR